ncbi:MAG: protein-methionine-sulfoxide reductase heme-binding subunit MsrQ [Gemmatimonadales bacterium]
MSAAPAAPRRRRDLVRWVLKPLLWIGCLGPLAWLVRGLFTGDLGVDPVKTLTHTTGLSALVILLIALSVTPARRLTGYQPLVRLRRPFGLFAFCYALLHFLIYAVFDHRLSPSEIGADIVEHPWVLVGFAAFLILLALAVTSPGAAVRRLGGRRWQRLHRLVYPAGALAVLHFYWLVKRDVTEPLWYGAALGVILAGRLLPERRRRRTVAEPGTGY